MLADGTKVVRHIRFNGTPLCAADALPEHLNREQLPYIMAQVLGVNPATGRPLLTLPQCMEMAERCEYPSEAAALKAAELLNRVLVMVNVTATAVAGECPFCCGARKDLGELERMFALEPR